MHSSFSAKICKYYPDAPLIETYRTGNLICLECGLVVSVGEFMTACGCMIGDESKVKFMLERDPGLLNRRDNFGYTGLMLALAYGHHSLSRWLLSLPGLHTSIRDVGNRTALHCACAYKAPLDILISLVRLCSWETVNMKDRWGKTSLDKAVQFGNTSAALYLSWLGAECEENNRNCYYTSGGFTGGVKHTFTKVTLQTWIEAGCQEEAQYWAVVANAVNALIYLVDVENVKLDRPKLSKLAKLFGHRETWSYVTNLQNLCWERIKQTVTAVVNLSPEHLLEGGVAGPVAGVLIKMRNKDP